MATFNSYVSLPKGIHYLLDDQNVPAWRSPFTKQIPPFGDLPLTNSSRQNEPGIEVHPSKCMKHSNTRKYYVYVLM